MYWNIKFQSYFFLFFILNWLHLFLGHFIHNQNLRSTFTQSNFIKFELQIHLKKERDTSDVISNWLITHIRQPNAIHSSYNLSLLRFYFWLFNMIWFIRIYHHEFNYKSLFCIKNLVFIHNIIWYKIWY